MCVLFLENDPTLLRVRSRVTGRVRSPFGRFWTSLYSTRLWFAASGHFHRRIRLLQLVWIRSISSVTITMGPSFISLRPRRLALADAPPSHLRRHARALRTGALLALPILLLPHFIVPARCSPPPLEFPHRLDSSASRLPLATSRVFLLASHAHAPVIPLASYHSSRCSTLMSSTVNRHFHDLLRP